MSSLKILSTHFEYILSTCAHTKIDFIILNIGAVRSVFSYIECFTFTVIAYQLINGFKLFAEANSLLQVQDP